MLSFIASQIFWNISILAALTGIIIFNVLQISQNRIMRYRIAILESQLRDLTVPSWLISLPEVQPQPPLPLQPGGENPYETPTHSGCQS